MRFQLRKAAAASFLGLTLLGAACGGGSGEGGSDDFDELERQVFDNFGIDADNLNSGDIAAGEFDSDAVDAMVDDIAEAAAKGLAGSGGGTIVVDNITYSFDAEVCYAHDNDITATGPFTGSDGSSGYATVMYTHDTYEEIADVMGEVLADMRTGDNDYAEMLEVMVHVDATNSWSSAPDGSPEWSASTAFGLNELVYSVDGNTVSGAGTVGDGNGVALTLGETTSLTFEAGCD
jgi:hypothetical protein